MIGNSFIKELIGFYLHVYKAHLWNNLRISSYHVLKISFQVDQILIQRLYGDCMCNINQEVRDDGCGAFHELFLWAVINNLPDLMHLLWLRGEDFLRKTLIGECASKLMIEIGEKHRMLDDVISDYKSNEK